MKNRCHRLPSDISVKLAICLAIYAVNLFIQMKILVVFQAQKYEIMYPADMGRRRTSLHNQYTLVVYKEVYKEISNILCIRLETYILETYNA